MIYLLSQNTKLMHAIKYYLRFIKGSDKDIMVVCPDGVRRTSAEKIAYENILSRCGDRASSIAVYLYEGNGLLEHRRDMIPILDQNNKLRRLRAMREGKIEFKFQLARRYAAWKWKPVNPPFETCLKQELIKKNTALDDQGNPKFPLHIKYLPKNIVAYINATGGGYPSKTTRHECREMRNWADSDFRVRWQTMLEAGEVLLLSDHKLGLFEQKPPAGILAHPDVVAWEAAEAEGGNAPSVGLAPPRL